MRDESLSPAETYERFFGPAMFEPLAGRLLEIARPAPGERVLDVACGTGIVTRRLPALVGAEGRVVGLDLSPDMLEVARGRAGDAAIEWRLGDATGSDLPDASFDVVLCQQGLQFFPDRAAGARELRRVLDDGGRAVVAVWHGLDHVPPFRAIIEAESEHLDAPPETFAVPFSLGDADELRGLFSDAGFGSVDVVEVEVRTRFEPAERFVELAVRAAAAVMPELGEGGPEAVGALTEATLRQAGPVLEEYRDGDALAFPMVANVAVARV